MDLNFWCSSTKKERLMVLISQEVLSSMYKLLRSASIKTEWNSLPNNFKTLKLKNNLMLGSIITSEQTLINWSESLTLTELSTPNKFMIWSTSIQMKRWESPNNKSIFFSKFSMLMVFFLSYLRQWIHLKEIIPWRFKQCTWKFAILYSG